jgi:transcriptional regulator with PAS, ATPase and Fis domain
MHPDVNNKFEVIEMDEIIRDFLIDPCPSSMVIGGNIQSSQTFYQRELLNSLCRLASAFEMSLDGLVIIDQDFQIQQITPRARNILGISPNQLTSSLDKIPGQLCTHIKKMLTEGVEFTDVEVIMGPSAQQIHLLTSGKPIRDRNDIIGGVIKLRHIKEVNRLVNRFSRAEATYRLCDVIGDSQEMVKTRHLANLAASSNANVLLEGESGTGKEVLAQAIHNGSMCSEGPFVVINCGAIPRDLVASELLGYEEGSFTGAKRGGRPGKFEMASGGTLFLDEIGDMPLEQQVSLLRVLQERKLTRLGGDKIISVDVRVICATNKSLLNEIKQGIFRQDLYYRINVISIETPPLRTHRDDIPILFNYFLSKLCNANNLKIEYVDDEVIKGLMNYDWPGNVRELQNVVERIVSLVEEDRICIYHLPDELLTANHSYSKTIPKNVKEKLKESEIQQLIKIYSDNKGNISRTANELGMSRTTLYRKLHQYEIA